MVVPVVVPVHLRIPRLRKRVGERRPRLLACLHLLVAEQARAERRRRRAVVELLTDAHELRLPVAVLLVPERRNLLLEAGRPQLTIQRVPPWRPRGEAELGAGEGGMRLLPVARRDPCDPG